MCNGEWKDHKSAGEGRRLARQPPPLQRGRSAVRDQERQDRPRRRAQGRGAEEVERLIDRVCRSGFSRELLLPLLRRQGRAGRAPFGSARTVTTPSQPPPAVAYSFFIACPPTSLRIADSSLLANESP